MSVLGKDDLVSISACVLLCAQLFSFVWLFVTLWAVAHQVPLSLGFFRQEYWNGWPFPSAGYFPHPGMESASLVSPASQAHFLPAEPLGKPCCWFLLECNSSSSLYSVYITFSPSYPWVGFICIWMAGHFIFSFYLVGFNPLVFFSLISVLCYIDGFVNVEPFLWIWDEAHLVRGLPWWLS